MKQNNKSFHDTWALFVSISIGIFIFILFFQPFSLGRFDFDNRLIFVSGFGAIMCFFMYMVRIIFSLILGSKDITTYNFTLASSLSGFIILVLSSVSFAFYLRFVGYVSITFFIMIKVVLICLVPPIIIRLYDLFRDLKQQNEWLIAEKNELKRQIGKFEEENLNKTIEFVSENQSETLNISIAELVLVKSADNYVEIVFTEGNEFRKKLIRNTLKNIEFQLKKYSNLIRCHRVSIVNIHYVEKLNRNFNNYWISVKGYNEQVPVSRQYLLKLKEALHNA